MNVPSPEPPVHAHPFTAAELETAWSQWSGYSPVLADVLLVMARTGLRWCEARVLTVGDADPEQLVVDKSGSEGRSLRQLPSGQSRRVPVPRRVRPVVRRLVADRDREELLFTTSLGEPLRRSVVLRRLHWPETGCGRQLQDLRHTAASLWLAEGVAPSTVRSWMGPTRLAG